MSPSPNQRLWLNVPFNDNHLVKELGARFDSAVRKWWITRRGAEKNPGIYRWMTGASSGFVRRLKDASAFLDGKAEALRQAQQKAASPYQPGAPVVDPCLPECDCSLPPWEHCLHSIA